MAEEEVGTGVVSVRGLSEGRRDLVGGRGVYGCRWAGVAVFRGESIYGWWCGWVKIVVDDENYARRGAILRVSLRSIGFGGKGYERWV